MNSFYVFAILGFLTIAPNSVTMEEPPILKLYEVDERNNIVRDYDRRADTSTAVIIDNIGHLRLECEASYPVQWTYTGNGIPIREESHNQHTASVFLSHLNERHTGTYQCGHTESLTPSSFLHIFVPGQNLFTSVEGKTIDVFDDESSVLIPCSVSHPRVQVSLKKSTREGLVKPVTKSGNEIMYTPRNGFRINLDDIVDPEGTYVCTAHHDDIERSVDYRLVYEHAPERFLEFKQRPEETCRGESCASHCETHSDCPPMWNCYADQLCRDPCAYSKQCGKEANCRVIYNVPECYCPPGFVGDANTECYNR